MNLGLKEKISEIIKKNISERIEIKVSVPENEKFGHYSTNIAFQLSKTRQSTPLKVAEEIKSKIENQKSDIIAKIEVVSPGFINFWLQDEVLLAYLKSVLKNPDQWGKSNIGQQKVVRLEYFQLNVAKIPHIGHLRSAVIGDALKRIFSTQGYKVVSDTHIGDWGTQFGILIYGYKSLSDQEREKIKQNPIEELSQLYIAENKRIEEDPKRREKAKEEFAKLEKGDKENKKIWQWMVDVSMEKFQEIIDQLDLRPFEEHRGESAYEDMMPEITQLALDKKVAQKIDDGAVIVDLLDYKLGKAVLVKSDGASTYLLRDLATLKYWKKQWQFWQNLYVVDVRQAYHFKQLFKVAELLGFDGVSESWHIEFGFMSLPEGAMSTRKGAVISLRQVLTDIIQLAREVIQKKNPDLKNADEVAEMVGIGALKYFDLSHYRKSNIIFDREKALSFEGNTGPYIQYTNARFQSILRKINNKEISEDREVKVKIDDDERRLLVSVLQFPEIIESVLIDWAPHILANYLFSLAQRANEFYHSHPVTQEKNIKKKAVRIMLVQAVSLTLIKGLNLLGIQAPAEM